MNGWTGRPAGMLQDDERKLSKWLAGRPDSMLRAREAAAGIAASRNGCHNRAPFQSDMRVQDGWIPHAIQRGDMLDVVRTARMVDVPFRMAQDCRYTHTELGQADKGCTGCRWKVEAKRNG